MKFRYFVSICLQLLRHPAFYFVVGAVYWLTLLGAFNWIAQQSGLQVRLPLRKGPATIEEYFLVFLVVFGAPMVTMERWRVRRRLKENLDAAYALLEKAQALLESARQLKSAQNSTEAEKLISEVAKLIKVIADVIKSIMKEMSKL